MRELVHALCKRIPAIVALTSAGAWGGAAAAGGMSAGCAAANQGALNAHLAPSDSVRTQALLDKGEILKVAIQSSGSASVTMIEGPGAPRRLLSGNARSLSFAAPEAGGYAFQYTADDRAPAAITVACVPLLSTASRDALLARRAGLALSEEPDRLRIDRQKAPLSDAGVLPQAGDLDEDGRARRVKASVSLSDIAAAVDPSKRKDPGIVDFWIEGRYQAFDAPKSVDAYGNGNLSVMYLGSKYMLGPDIMLGAMAQFDRADETSAMTSSTVSASGWMAGPYVSVRMGQGVIFDGRAAWGTAELGAPGFAYSGEAADQRLVRGQLRGDRQLSGWTVAPSVGLSYLETTPRGEAFGPAAGASGAGRLEILPEVKRRFDLNSETYVEPRAAFGGFVGFDDLAKLNPSQPAITTHDLNLKAEAGVAVGVKDGMKLEASGGVESSGVPEASDTWLGRLRLNVPLNK